MATPNQWFRHLYGSDDQAGGRREISVGMLDV